MLIVIAPHRLHRGNPIPQAAVHMDEEEPPAPEASRSDVGRLDPQTTTRDYFGRSHHREWSPKPSPERKDHTLTQGLVALGGSPDPGAGLPVTPPQLSMRSRSAGYASSTAMMGRSGAGQDAVVARLKAQLADYIRLEHMHGAADRPRRLHLHFNPISTPFQPILPH